MRIKENGGDISIEGNVAKFGRTKIKSIANLKGLSK